VALRVLVADDHALLRQGVRQALELEPDIEVVAEADGGQRALELMRLYQPDVAILDISMPGQNGVEVARAIKRDWPRTGIVVLTIHSDDSYVFAAVEAGVSAYVLKDVKPELLVRAVREAAAGRSFLHPAVAGQLMREFSRRSHRQQDLEPLADLTARETEVLALLAGGLSNSQIARSLYIAEKTVKNHLSHIFSKLGVKDRTNAALIAIKCGLTGPALGHRSHGAGTRGSGQ
jgi:DNA-binding NarL/FixJ family response regulator